jgi:TonB family protein
MRINAAVGLFLIAFSVSAYAENNLSILQRQENIYRSQRLWDKDGETLKEIIALWSARFGADSVGIEPYYSRLGSALMRTGDYSGAEQAFRSGLSVLEPAGSLYSFAANRAKRQLIRALEKQDKTAEAEQLRSSLTPEPPYVKPDTNPELIEKHGEAQYTDAARIKSVSGGVFVFIEITETGEVKAAYVLEPLGFGLDENAVSTVSKWKFKPASLNGAPIASTATAEVSFRNLN